MRRLSIKLTCVLALLPAIASGGCSMKAESEVAYADAKTEGREMAGPSSGAHGGGDYGDYLVDEAPSVASEEVAVGPSGPMDGEGERSAAASDAPAPTSAPPGTVSRGDSKSKASSASPAKAEGGKRDKGGEEAKIARDDEDSSFGQRIQSGTLTAGSFDDNLNGWVFDRFLEQVKQQPDLASLANAFTGQRTVLRVQDSQGRPIANAKVDIDGKQLTTRTDGRVVYVPGWDGSAQSRNKANISFGNAKTSVTINKQLEQLVTLDAQGALPTKLDFALVIDATGSMGDEMEYLKVEIRDIAEAIERHFPNVDQRFALIVYRDDGDEYVTKVFDFTDNLERFQDDLGGQSAGGGGDYPEAMDSALEATNQLSWRSGDTARVTFLVADAPPHTNDIDDTLEAVDDLRAKGIAIYPVASSGVAGEAEFVMRSTALLTGAQYMFLTDDSGVGNPHAEPHIPCYTVEQLAPLMVRAVRSELSGKRVEAEEKFTIRTVGKGQAGMCEKPKSAAKLAK
ncbi:vWA domain-containing protein [Nannocystaceae bacterium ST9]